MEWKFVKTAALYLAPIIILNAFFVSQSLQITGYPIGTSDAVGTHYLLAAPGGYPPAITFLNSVMVHVMPLSLWFSLFAFTVCFYLPFVLTYLITKRFEPAMLLVYGTAITTNNFVVGLLPQAVLVDLALFMWWMPELFLLDIGIGYFVHSIALFVLPVVFVVRELYAPD